MKTHLHSFKTLNVVFLISFLSFSNAFSQNFSEWISASNPGNWSDNANWTNGTGYGQLEFKGGGSAVSNNDLGTISQWRLYFNGGQFYNLTGDKVNLLDFGGQSSWILSDSSESQNISLEICFCDNGFRPAWITARGSGSFSFQRDIEIAGNVTSLSIAKFNGGQVNVNGVISGINKDVFIGRDDQFNLAPSSGNVSFSNVNTYSGDTYIDAGILYLSNNASLPNSDVFISSGAILFLTGNTTSTVLSVRERGTGNGGRIEINSGSTLNINDPAGIRFQNRITGSGQLNKNGPGTLSLYGNHNFSGNIVVNDGILATSSAIPVSSLTINNGGRFDASTATNTIPQASSVIVNSGGEIRFLADQTLDDLEVSGTLFIDNGVTLTIENSLITETADIQGGGTLIINGIWTNSNGITTIDSGTDVILTSDMSGSAQFGQSSGTISDEVTVERYIPAGLPDLRRAFRFLTSSINSTGSINANWQQSGLNIGDTGYEANVGTHITGGLASDGFDQSGSNNPSMFTFDNTNQNSTANQDDDWYALSNTNSKTLKAGEAYLIFIRGDRSIDLTSNSEEPTNTSLRASGFLHVGPRVFSSANNATIPEYGLSNQADFYSLVGNPYQAIVDINSLDFTNVKSNFYWVWDPNLGSQGQYTTVSLPSGLNNTTSPANQFVQPGQSFFVQTIADGAASLTFNEDDKNTLGGATSIFSEQNEPSIQLLLYTAEAFNTGKRESDGTLINLSDSANNAKDDFDADKFIGPGENLARLNGNELISIENRAMPTEAETLAISITGYSEDNYTFVVNATNVQDYFEAYLLDNYTEAQIQLNEGATQINFSVDANIPASIAEDRFSLIFDNTTLGIDDNNFGANFSLYPNPTSNGQFSIKTPSLSGEVTIEISNLLGQQVSIQELTVEGQQVDVNAQNLSDGLYVVKLSQGNQSFSFKLIMD